MCTLAESLFSYVSLLPGRQVQALLSLLDKEFVGLYDPEVARDVLTMVRGCIFIGRFLC